MSPWPLVGGLAFTLGITAALIGLFWGIGGAPAPVIASQFANTNVLFVQCTLGGNAKTGLDTAYLVVFAIFILLCFGVSMLMLLSAYPQRSRYNDQLYLTYAMTNIFFISVFLVIVLAVPQDTVSKVVYR